MTAKTVRIELTESEYYALLDFAEAAINQREIDLSFSPRVDPDQEIIAAEAAAAKLIRAWQAS